MQWTPVGGGGGAVPGGHGMTTGGGVGPGGLGPGVGVGGGGVTFGGGVGRGVGGGGLDTGCPGRGQHWTHPGPGHLPVWGVRPWQFWVLVLVP